MLRDSSMLWETGTVVNFCLLAFCKSASLTCESSYFKMTHEMLGPRHILARDAGWLGNSHDSWR